MNIDIEMTLDDAVNEVLGLLTGLDLAYEPEQDRYRTITRQLNRALRANALEQEWGYYASELEVGKAVKGQRDLLLPNSVRPRIINDDSVRFKKDGRTVIWAYFLPRESLSKYEGRPGLWCAVTRQNLEFSRPFTLREDGLTVFLPVMREPRMFRLPPTGEEVSDIVRNQRIDFDYPDVVITRAAFYYVQTDPVMQPRTQTLEAAYKDLMYQIMERDKRNTDMPYSNEFELGIQNGLVGDGMIHWHPHAEK